MKRKSVMISPDSSIDNVLELISVRIDGMMEMLNPKNVLKLYSSSDQSKAFEVEYHIA